MKISLLHLFILELRPHPFLTMPTKKNFQSNFNFYEFVSKWEKKGYLSILSEDITDLKILQSDWLRAFRPLSRELDFTHRICVGSQQIIETFIIEAIQKKSLTKFFSKFKTPIVGGKKTFPTKIRLCQIQLHLGF